MTWFWGSDTCLCQFVVDENFNYVDWIQKCQIHKNSNGVGLLTSVLAHHRGFNGRSQGNRTEKDQVKRDKANEQSRIRNLGTPEKNTTVRI